MWIKLWIDLFLCPRSTTYLPIRNMEVILKSQTQSSEEKYMYMFFTLYIFLFSLGTPTRNEKFLAAVATGKWVLHKSYFQACEQESHFVQVCFILSYFSLCDNRDIMAYLEF